MRRAPEHPLVQQARRRERVWARLEQRLAHEHPQRLAELRQAAQADQRHQQRQRRFVEGEAHPLAAPPLTPTRHAHSRAPGAATRAKSRASLLDGLVRGGHAPTLVAQGAAAAAEVQAGRWPGPTVLPTLASHSSAVGRKEWAVRQPLLPKGPRGVAAARMLRAQQQGEEQAERALLKELRAQKLGPEAAAREGQVLRRPGGAFFVVPDPRAAPLPPVRRHQNRGGVFGEVRGVQEPPVLAKPAPFLRGEEAAAAAPGWQGGRSAAEGAQSLAPLRTAVPGARKEGQQRPRALVLPRLVVGPSRASA